MIYLDNGATTFPKPQSVKLKVNESFNKYSANPGRSGHRLSLMAATEIYECRKSIKKLFNANSEDNVIFTLNCTMALNTVIFGMLKKGDHVVISSLEHNSVVRPLEYLKNKGVSYSVFDYSDDPDEIIDNVRSAIKPETKLCVCMHASNVFGFKFPIERICALCHFYGIKICIDAAQSAGVFPIDMQNSDFDFVCTSGHKGLYGPMGTGILLINNAELKPLLFGGTGTDSINTQQPDEPPERFESGTQNLNGIAGLRAGVDFVRKRGTMNIYKHEFFLAKHLYNELGKLPFVKLYNKNFEFKKTAPVLSFNIDEIHSEEVVRVLNNNGICVRGGLHCSPFAHKFMNTIDSGTVRVVPSIFSTRFEIDRLIYVIKNISPKLLAKR
ncbi:MAG: aminotransferase class V-fold PLP-dependent enzyme [Ruminococcus sp.]|nr:aminotransferase class V-fold PLP-dependent enzyme [Ruminococcus sp.]